MISSRRDVAAAVIAAALVTGAAGGARAADGLAPAITEVGPDSGTRRGPGLWARTAGRRVWPSGDRGAGPFSTDDVFDATSVMLTRAFWGQERAVLYPAVGVQWEWGQRKNDARGVEASLALQRVGLVIEERWAPWRHAYFSARVAPGAQMG